MSWAKKPKVPLPGVEVNSHAVHKGFCVSFFAEAV
jgi:hypothetical protein